MKDVRKAAGLKFLACLRAANASGAMNQVRFRAVELREFFIEARRVEVDQGRARNVAGLELFLRADIKDHVGRIRPQLVELIDRHVARRVCGKEERRGKKKRRDEHPDSLHTFRLTHARGVVITETA